MNRTALVAALLLSLPAIAQDAPERVTMSLDEFLRLYEGARTRPKDPPAAPRTHSLASATYQGEVLLEGGEPKSVLLTGAFRVEVHQPTGFVKIPLLSSEVALIEATIDGRPAPLVLEGNAYTLVTDRKGAFEVKARFAASATTSQGASSFGFDLVPSGGTSLKLAIPGTDALEVAVAGARMVKDEVVGGRRLVEAALPSSGRLAVSWQRDARPAPGTVEEPRVYAEVQTLVGVGDGLVRATTTVQHTILFAGVRSFRYDLPDGVTVLDVRGSGLREWIVDTKGDLVVQLNYAAESSYALALDLEQVVKGATLPTPIVRPLGVERTKGWVGVVADGGLEIAPGDVKGATPVDVRTLPASILGLTSQPVLLGFKYLGEGASVPLTVTEHDAVDVLVTLLDQADATTMFTEHGRRLTRVIYDVRNNRRQFLGVRLPEGATLWSAAVAGRAVQPARASDGAVLLPLLRSTSSGSGLSSFPVEVVYVEEGTAATGRSTFTAALPKVDVPVNYVGWTIHAPMGARILASTASGDLRVVPALSRPVGARETMVVDQAVSSTRNTAGAQVDAGVLGNGATPVRVELPVEGPAIQLERLLVLDEALKVSFDWKPAR